MFLFSYCPEEDFKSEFIPAPPEIPSYPLPEVPQYVKVYEAPVIPHDEYGPPHEEYGPPHEEYGPPAPASEPLPLPTLPPYVPPYAPPTTLPPAPYPPATLPPPPPPPVKIAPYPPPTTTTTTTTTTLPPPTVRYAPYPAPTTPAPREAPYPAKKYSKYEETHGGSAGYISSGRITGHSAGGYISGHSTIIHKPAVYTPVRVTRYIKPKFFFKKKIFAFPIFKKKFL